MNEVAIPKNVTVKKETPGMMDQEQKDVKNIASTVKKMVELHEKIQKKNSELKVLRKTYKELTDSCKKFMVREKIDIFDTKYYEVIKKVRNPPCTLNTTFIESTLKEYFDSSGLSKSSKLNSKDATEYLMKKRKKKAVEKSSIALKKKKSDDKDTKVKQVSLSTSA